MSNSPHAVVDYLNQEKNGRMTARQGISRIPYQRIMLHALLMLPNYAAYAACI